MTPPDILLWLVVIVILGPTAIAIAIYLLAFIVGVSLALIDKVTP